MLDAEQLGAGAAGRHASWSATRGEVAFEDVSFAYPGGPNILRDVSFTGPPGHGDGAGRADRRRQVDGDEPAAAPVGPGRRAAS